MRFTGLGNGNDVVAHRDGRQAVLLDRGRNLVASKLNILEHDGVEARILEGHNRLDANRALLEELEFRNPKSGLVPELLVR